MNKHSIAQPRETVTALPRARDAAWEAKALSGLRNLEGAICDLEHMASLAGDVIAEMLEYENGELVGTSKYRKYLISEAHSEQVIFAAYHAGSLAKALREQFYAALDE